MIIRLVAALAVGWFSTACAAAPRDEFLALRDPANRRFALGGVSAAEAGLRYGIARDDSVAVERAIDRLPEDSLLRLLHRGLAHHRAGRWTESNAALQAAEQLAEERYTKSMRQAVGAALLNDRVLDYIPPAHERAFIHYYGMLNYLALGSEESALVEARKANLFLDRYAREHAGRAYTVDAAVEYVAGSLHLNAGDRNDALVSFRKADSAYGAYALVFGLPAPAFVASDVARLATRMGVDAKTAAKSVSARQQGAAPDSTGYLLVLVENGYIAHKVQQKLYVAITESERRALRRHRHGDHFHAGDAIVRRTLSVFSDPGTSEYSRRHADGVAIGALASGGELLTLAWPRFELAASAADSVRVNVGDTSAAAVLMNDLSAIAVRNFEEDKPTIVARAILRGALKFALAKYAEEKAEEEGEKRSEGTGKLWKFGAKVLGQGVSAATEQADTRSWSTLPAEILGLKLALPRGEHAVSVDVYDRTGQPRRVELGVVRIEAGRLAVRSVAVEGSDRGSRERMLAAARGVRYQLPADSIAAEDPRATVP